MRKLINTEDFKSNANVDYIDNNKNKVNKF